MKDQLKTFERRLKYREPVPTICELTYDDEPARYYIGFGDVTPTEYDVRQMLYCDNKKSEEECTCECLLHRLGSCSSIEHARRALKNMDFTKEPHVLTYHIRRKNVCTIPDKGSVPEEVSNE